MDELTTVEAYLHYGDYPDDYTKGGKTTYDGNAARTMANYKSSKMVCSTIREQAKLKRKPWRICQDRDGEKKNHYGLLPRRSGKYCIIIIYCYNNYSYLIL